jgi:branched-chain amino acid transport system ATP-binding protein
MLEIKNLNAGYRDLRILKDVSLRLPNDKITVLMGPNGAGKSTLLSSIYGLARVLSGQIIYNGIDITNFPTHKLISLGISCMPQGKINFSNLSVEENLLIGGYHLRGKKLARKKLAKIYEQFSVLQEKQKQTAFTLSGGQQQILAIGRALMAEPKLLLLDEPSLGLAPMLVKEIFQIIKKLNQEFGVSVLVVEHNIKSIMEVAYYGYVLVNGEIVAQDECLNLKKSEIIKKVFVGELE